MKQLSLFALTVIGTLILGSCSTSNNVVGGGIFQKRKYTGGVYWDRSEKLKSTKGDDVEFDISKNEIESQKKYVSSTTIYSESSDANEVVASNNSTPSDIIESLEAAPVTKSKISIVSNSSNPTVDNTTVGSEEVVMQEKQNTNKGKHNSAPAADAMTILLVILAIIIPPLAVFIFEGASGRFWIDLILAILGWGAFGIFGGIFWLCGLAAVIYALLIVLGVI